MRTMFALILVLFVCVVNAEEQFRIENGQLYVSSVKVACCATGVKVTPAAQKYPNQAVEAYRLPGKTISVEWGTNTKVISLFHLRKEVVQKVGVRYDSTASVVDVTTEPVVIESKEIFFSFLILWLISVGGMLVSNFFLIKRYDSALAVFGFPIVSLLTVLAAPVLFAVRVPVSSICLGSIILASATAGTAIIASGVNAVAIAAEYGDMMRWYIRNSSVYYMAMLVMAGSVYSPLFS